MALKLYPESSIQAIATAIRAKNGESETYTVGDMADAIADIPNTYTAGDEGKVVSNGALVSQSSTTKSANGTYDTTLNNSVTVAVPQPTGNINITDTAQTNVAAYATAQVVDANLVAGNIKKDVNILGITGTYEGGGGGGDAMLASYMDGSITELVVPSTSDGLAKNSVYRRENLVRVVINASGTIADYGVSSNNALKHIVVGDGITEIKANAFGSNSALETIEIGSGITLIEKYLWSSTIPTNMQSVTIRATTPPTINGQTFNGVGPNHPVAFYVPQESVDAYKAASYWSNYASYIQAIP